MLGAGFGHALDHEVAELRDVHLHALADTQAPWPRRRAIDAGERFLQPRIVRREDPAVDQETLLVHAMAVPSELTFARFTAKQHLWGTTNFRPTQPAAS